MNEQEENRFSTGEDSYSPDAGAVDGEYHFSRSYPAEHYTDAHYESADDTTVPPRYYTPPEKSVREEKTRTRSSKSSGSGGRVAGILCAILAAALLGGFCGAAFTGARLNARLSAVETRLVEQEAAAQEMLASAAEAAASGEREGGAAVTSDRMDPADIYDQATRQVVGVRTEITRTNFFGMTSSGAVSGSGFIISSDGYILTNYHVVEEAYERRLTVQVMTYDGNSYNASIVGVEPSNDIAVLKIDASGLDAAVLGNSDSIRVGDSVYAVGNPLGELEFSMSTGHVSALDRVITTEESESINMFQIDAAVNEGNSGGPVYDAYGDVVGIVTAKYSSSGVEGLGFAIPINDVKAITDDLVTKGYVTGKAYMGVSVREGYNAMYSQYYETPLGAMIESVSPNSAAERAGLQRYDIITAVGDYKVEDYSGLKSALRHFSAYDTAELTVYRDATGEELHLTITFDEEKPNN